MKKSNHKKMFVFTAGAFVFLFIGAAYGQTCDELLRNNSLQLAKRMDPRLLPDSAILIDEPEPYIGMGRPDRNATFKKLERELTVLNQRVDQAVKNIEHLKRLHDIKMVAQAVKNKMMAQAVKNIDNLKRLRDIKMKELSKFKRGTFGRI